MRAVAANVLQRFVQGRYGTDRHDEGVIFRFPVGFLCGEDGAVDAARQVSPRISTQSCFMTGTSFFISGANTLS